MVLAQRRAFVRGRFRCPDTSVEQDRIDAEAVYPLPKITRPRVYVSPNGISYRVVNGTVECALGLGGFRPVFDTRIYVGVADLLAKPTETVEAPE